MGLHVMCVWVMSEGKQSAFWLHSLVRPVFYAESQRPRVVNLPRWKKIIALSVASALKDHQPPATKATRTSGPGSDSYVVDSTSSIYYWHLRQR